MHWIVQENLINPATRDHLVSLLQDRKTPFNLAKLVPFFHQLEVDLAEPVGPVFVYGSTGLGHVAKARRWRPGYFDAGLDYEVMLAQYGDLALNAGAVCAPLGEMQRRFDRFFVRPVNDEKSFAGGVMTWEAFEAFRAGVGGVADQQDATLHLSDRVVVAPLTEIAAEFRFFAVGSRVVAGSLYKLGDRVHSSGHVPLEVARFAQDCVDLWAPNQAFAIDIAVTPQGLRVIEVNSANSAGFYACDVGAIVDAVNDLR